ncbi:unnamed protein product [Schistocephalus solidus]|uniref:Longin domain-containing protein n=1 Tax=Schistocephalus solidus TaxID=70667 RepID=A0A183TQI0_SCHSO|nr:unnamed protein product [Schistocephalus solidus]
MKLYSLQVLLKEENQVKQLQGVEDLSSFNFFQRGSLLEFLNFTAKLVCERTNVCERTVVQEQEYFCHVYVRHDRLCGILFSDLEYPQRVAQTLLTKVFLLTFFSNVHFQLFCLSGFSPLYRWWQVVVPAGDAGCVFCVIGGGFSVCNASGGFKLIGP